MNWKDYRKKTKVIELSVIIMAVLFLCIGCIFDYTVFKGFVMIYVKNINDLSLAILQIQATISTLTITIIALLSSTISDSYMGVPVSNYFLEIRPYVLTQKRLICLEFTVLLVGLFAHLFGLHNVVICNFIASILLIIESVFGILEVFKGRRNALTEIESYIHYKINNNIDCLDVGTQFINDWKEIASEQSSETFDLYSNIFFKVISKILSNDQVGDVNSLSESISSFLLSHESKKCRIKGIGFVIDYYNKIWNWINTNQKDALFIYEPISLISRVDFEWYRAVDSIEAEIIEKEDFDFNDFFETVIKVSSWIDFSKDNDSNEVLAIYSIARGIGRYLDKQFKKGNIVNPNYWQRVFANRALYYSYYSPKLLDKYMPEKSIKSYKESLALRDFNVFYGFLLSGQLKFVKNGFFNNDLNNIDMHDEVIVLRQMVMHCFMYYYAFRESVQCVDENLQKEIKEMLMNRDFVCLIKQFYNKLALVPDALNECTENKMEGLLQQYESFPKHSEVKTMIMDNVVRDYFLYVALLLAEISIYRNLLEKILSTQLYYTYLTESGLKNLKQRFVEMHKIFENSEFNEDQAIIDAEEKLLTFARVMKKKYKDNVIKEAEIEQKKFESENTHSTAKSKLNEKIEVEVKTAFSSFDVVCDNKNTYEKIHLYTIWNYTRFIGTEYDWDYSKKIIAKIFAWIEYELASKYNLEQIDRNDYFDSDESFREYLNQNRYEVLFGAQFVFGETNSRGFLDHSEFLSKKDCRFIANVGDGIALRKDALYVKVNDLIFNIKSPEIDDIEVSKNEESGLYMYSPTQGITLDFEEEELREFLHNERKIIDIYANVTIGFNNQQGDGVIIQRRPRNREPGTRKS